MNVKSFQASVYVQDSCRLNGFSNAMSFCFFFAFPLSPSRVYLVAQERQDEVSNWLCVQVMLSNFKHYSITRAKRTKVWGKPYEEEKKTLVISEK